MIKVQDLIFEYPTRRVLFEVSFEIQEKTITALVGPNGAGKTTLMRCLAALAVPFSGSIHIDGFHSQEDPHSCHRRIGYLADLFGLYNQLTVYQSLFYAARIRGLDGDLQAHVLHTAERLRLKDRLHQKAGELSRGLRQRLGIGQAIIHQPKVLLLDEPASGLDPEARQELSKLLLRLRDEGMTILVSSHILSELEEYSSHLMVIREGRVLSYQPLSETHDDSPPSEAASTSSPASAPRKPRIRRLRLTTARDEVEISPYLSGFPSVQELRCKDRTATFVFTGEVTEQHELLKALLEAGFSVCAMQEEKTQIADIYLGTKKEDASS